MTVVRQPQAKHWRGDSSERRALYPQQGDKAHECRREVRVRRVYEAEGSCSMTNLSKRLGNRAVRTQEYLEYHRECSEGRLKYYDVKEKLPPQGKTVFAYHEDDLYPVTAFYMSGAEPSWLRDTEGPEDDIPEQLNGIRYEVLLRPPTHWAFIPYTPTKKGEKL